MAHVVQTVDLEDVLVGVHGALHRRFLDRRELRIALEGHVRRFDVLLVDASRLRNLRQQYGFDRLIGSGDGRKHTRALVLDRNLLEVGRQGRRRERPRPGEV